jgi:membrane protein
MNRKLDPQGRNAMRAYHIPLKGWWQLMKDVVSKVASDNLSVVSAGCAFYALFAIFPALTASISLYGLTTDPETVERQFSMLKAVLPPQGYEIVIDQIRRIAETSGQTLGWSFGVSLAIALWSANLGTQAMFSALNIAYGEPERRSVLRFYLSAIGYTIIGILGGAAMLFAIVNVPVLFADAGLRAADIVHACADLPFRTEPGESAMALGERGFGLRHFGVAARVRWVLLLRLECRQL